MPPDTAARTRVHREMPLLRFDRVERTLHWVNATLFGILMLTGAALYAGPISTLVGNRRGRALPARLQRAPASDPAPPRGARSPRRAAPDRPRATQPLEPRRHAVVPAQAAFDDPPREVQSRPEAQRRVHRRRRRGDARDRVDHALVRACSRSTGAPARRSCTTGSRSASGSRCSATSSSRCATATRSRACGRATSPRSGRARRHRSGTGGAERSEETERDKGAGQADGCETEPVVDEVPR